MNDLPLLFLSHSQPLSFLFLNTLPLLATIIIATSTWRSWSGNSRNTLRLHHVQQLLRAARTPFYHKRSEEWPMNHSDILAWRRSFSYWTWTVRLGRPPIPWAPGRLAPCPHPPTYQRSYQVTNISALVFSKQLNVFFSIIYNTQP